MNAKGHCYPKYIILQAVYFKLIFTLSYHDVEEIMKIRGVLVDHATIQRWDYQFTPLLESEMKKRKGRVGASWRLDESYIKVKGIWCYLYRAVDKLGNTVGFLLTRKRQRMSVQSFLIKAISNTCRPRIINIDKIGSNTEAIKVYNKHPFSKIEIRQCKYLNNIAEQDHRFIKWRI
ncbi:IS6 family transposase [Flavobacterium sp. LC2016-12]|uniref:IS6 family transposase n=1 Tax=Flavobacterium sp. LC2016-12 TaxID=2783794 RepID=UPI001E4080D8|nr:IS6 family transposase [Flavobacterium sp. LC2016-12]